MAEFGFVLDADLWRTRLTDWKLPELPLRQPKPNPKPKTDPPNPPIKLKRYK